MDLRLTFSAIAGGVLAFAATVMAFAAVALGALMIQINALVAAQLAATLLGRPLQFTVKVDTVQFWAAGKPFWIQVGSGAVLLALAVGLFSAGVVAGRPGRFGTRQLAGAVRGQASKRPSGRPSTGLATRSAARSAARPVTPVSLAMDRDNRPGRE